MATIVLGSILGGLVVFVGHVVLGSFVAHVGVDWLGGSLRRQEQFWADWVPRCRQEHSRTGKKKQAVVYRVYKGRKEGYFIGGVML